MKMLSGFHCRLIVGWALVLSIEKVFQAQSAFEDGNLLVGKEEKLEIDTSSLIAKYTDTLGKPRSIAMYPHQGTADISETNKNFPYHVAELNYTGNVTFDRGSTISFKGNRSLSIQSRDGNINIMTDLILTCTDTIPDTCLGGYSVKSPQYGIYKGDGPGWKKYSLMAFGQLLQKCTPGAAHGGMGGISDKYSNGGTPNTYAVIYGRNDFKAMLGGSSGFINTKKTSKDILFYGGGAIELVAKNGTIYIDASISAHPVNGFAKGPGGDKFTGSSGGLIRLIAKEVKMTEASSLSVNGGDASEDTINYATPKPITAGNGGGSGGVIQIDAPKGIIYNVSLAGGKTHCKSSDRLPENGHLVIKGYYDTMNKTIESYKWPNESESSPPPETPAPTPAPNVSDGLPPLVKELVQLKENLKNGNSPKDLQNSILDHLDRLMNYSTAKNLTKEELLTFFHIFENYTEIINQIVSQNMSVNIQDIYHALLKLASIVMATNNQQNWKELEKLANFVGLVEKMAISISLNSTLDFQLDSIVVQSNLFDADETEGYKFPVHSRLKPNSFITQQDYIYIPKTSLSNSSGEYKMIILFFKDIQNGLPDSIQQSKESNQLLKVASLLMSCSLLQNGSLVTKLASPAFLHFALKKREGTEVKHQCSFWNTKNNSWDEEGISLKKSEPSKTICATTHFTSFAVLMQHTAIPMSGAHELALSLITYIGCGISSGTLLIALIVFLSIEGLTSDRHRIHLNLVVALLLAQILFLTGIKATENKTLCQVIAGALHYFFLTSFMWMLIEGVHLYMKVVKVFGIENIKVKQYFIIGWGVPALIVGAAAIYKHDGYGSKYVCWLSLDDGFVWAYIGPVVAIIAINCVILIVVIKTVVASASTMKSSEHSHIKAGIKGALVLMPLMGITWIFGLLAVNRDSIVFQYVFCIANSFQGFMIFLLHVVFNNEVRLAFKRQREKRQLSKESADYNASVSYSNDSNRKTWEKGSSSSGSTAKTGLSRLKARMSMSMTPRTSRVVSVQPINTIDDEVQVNRKFHNKGSSSEMSTTLHCPKGPDSGPKPPLHNPLRSRLSAEK